jgi:hypothetical protein
MEYKWDNYLYILLSDWYLTWSTSESNRSSSLLLWEAKTKHVDLVQRRHHYYLINCNLFLLWYSWKIALLALNNNRSLTPVSILELTDTFVLFVMYLSPNYLYILLSDWYLTWSTSESIISIFWWVIDIWHGVQVRQLSLYSVESITQQNTEIIVSLVLHFKYQSLNRI